MAKVNSKKDELQIEKKQWKKEGATLEKLIAAKGYSKYKFAMLCQFSQSRIYQLCNGECDIMTMQTTNMLFMARVLGYNTIDGLLRALGIDTLDELIQNRR